MKHKYFSGNISKALSSNIQSFYKYSSVFLRKFCSFSRLVQECPLLFCYHYLSDEILKIMIVCKILSHDYNLYIWNVRLTLFCNG
jgi:hypothetical protein